MWRNAIVRLSSACGWVAGALFACAVVVTCYEVLLRYAFNAPTIWAHETTILMCAAGYLLAGSFTQRNRGHIAITLLYDRTRGRLRRWLDVLIAAFSCTYLLALAWSAHGRAWESLMRWEGTGTAFNAPIPALLMPLLLIAAIVLALQVIANLSVDLANGPDRDDEPR